MTPFVTSLTHLFGYAMALLHVAIIILLTYRMVRGAWLPLLTVHAAVVRWFVAALPVAGLVLSLWYSEVVGLPVCALCWFGRTMLYPLAIMLPLAAWRRDGGVWLYAVPLTIVGALITGYQHLLQVGVVEGSVCAALRGAGDCAARYIFELGYITMPLFGFTLFVAIGLLLWIGREEREK